jgi:hypothetical protein
MKNTKLRDLLFDTIRNKKNLHWKILHSYYNEDVEIPIDIVLHAHINLLEEIMEIEWIKRNNVIHNASD